MPAVVTELCSRVCATCTAPIFTLGQWRPYSCLNKGTDTGQLLDTSFSCLNHRGASSATCNADFEMRPGNERGMIKKNVEMEKRLKTV